MTFNDLPFVKLDDTDTTVSTWDTSETGEYAIDYQIGRDYYDALRALMLSKQDTQYLHLVIYGQVRRGHWGPIEMGFHQRMAELSFL